MLERIKAAYTNYRSLRLAACAGLLACAILLYWLSGGFPPPAWRFLFQSLPRIPLLWQSQGVAVLLPLAGLVCLALTLLVLWVAIIAACIKMARYWWNDFLERRHFVEELQEAEQLAEQMALEEMQQAATVTGTTGTSGAMGNRAEPAAYIPQTPQPVLVPNNALVMQEAGRPVEARGRSATAVSPEPRIMQPFEHVEWQSEPAPPTAQSVSTAVAAPPAPPASPALARGQLRLVPRPDEEDDWEHAGDVGNEEDGDDEDEEDTDEIPEIARTPLAEPPGLEVGAGLHPGFHRKDAPNEDALFEIRGTHTTPSGLQHVGLFVVADGAGSAGFGQEAGRLAIQALSAVMVPALLNGTKVAFADLLRKGVQSANLSIYSRNRELVEMNCHMDTTLTVALVAGPTAYIASAGNSRAYLYRQQKGLVQVTGDAAASLVQKGMEELEGCLGRHASVEVKLSTLRLCDGDMLLLCSDGLWSMVRDAGIEETVHDAGLHPAQASTMLVQNALNSGGADNISVIVVRYTGNE